MALLAVVGFAQTGSVTGKVLEAATGQAAIGANVTLKGASSVGAVTNLDGVFRFINVPAGNQTLVITSIGFEETEVSVSVTSGQTTDLGTIELSEAIVGLKEVQVIASVAIDRRTPVAVSTIKGNVIEEKLGNQEFPEILKTTPGIYATKQGGGFGDARINIRGFNQRNVAVMINGIPVNDMENGWVYWSNWAGLSDVTSNMQVQRGLGASKLAVSSVGGSINIITNAAEIAQGGSAGVSVGNDGYQKYSLMYSTGLMDNGMAITLQGTRTAGNGYIQGTQFSAWSYFFSLSQQLGDNHTIAVTGLGAPQWHHQRSLGRFDGVTLETFQNENRGPRYNHLFGEYNGEEFSWRKNFYHKPKFFINHYWTVSPKVEIATSAYYSIGRGGGTGPRGRINTNGGNRIYDGSSRIRNENGHVVWDNIEAWNTGKSVADWGTLGTDPDFNNGRTTTSSGDAMIRRASMNEHTWFGVISNVTADLSENLTLVGGIDLRSYRGLHYRRVENLFGLDAYFSRGNDNNEGVYITEEGTRSDKNVINYNNDGLVRWASAYAQIEYSTNRLTLFASATGSRQGFQRIDYFQYAPAEQESDWAYHLGGTVKAGANFNINENHNVYVNAGYFSQQPIFDNVFPGFQNTIDTKVSNQAVTAIEAGYGLRTSIASANLNLYRTVWGNRQLSQSLRVDNPNDPGNPYDGLANFSNIAQVHQGIELDFMIRPVTPLTINGMVSLGDWQYASNFTADIINTDDQSNLGTLTLYMDGVKVGDAAQTTASLDVTYEIIKGLRVNVGGYYADDLYADFSVGDGEFSDKPVAGESLQAWKLPSYFLMDGAIYYNFKIASLDVTARFNMNNILDAQYIAESDTNIKYDADDTSDRDMGNGGSWKNRAFYGFGRTWNAGIKVRF